jgi:nitrite reductase/ring-hydroxylating ferredoxin subunit
MESPTMGAVMAGSKRADPTILRPASANTPRLPYPDGWFAVALRGDVRPGRVVRRRFMGEDVVVYRTRKGRIRVVQPYCPHLGAHLGFGGHVDGEDIVCPFHHFAYGPDGTCVRTGYGTRPPKATLVHWEVREVNGVIWIWRHARGAAPSWEIPVVPTHEFPVPVTHTMTVIDHPQEVVENAIDIGHFGAVHGTSGAEITRPLELTGPRLSLGTAVYRDIPLLGRFDVEFDVEAHGVGYVYVRAYMRQLKLTALVQIMPVPLDPCRIATRFTVSARIGSSGSKVARYSSWLATQLFAKPSWQGADQDTPIWRNKVYLKQPRLAPGDGPIMRFRGWAEQFYSSDLDDAANLRGADLREVSVQHLRNGSPMLD